MTHSSITQSALRRTTDKNYQNNFKSNLSYLGYLTSIDRSTAGYLERKLSQTRNWVQCQSCCRCFSNKEEERKTISSGNWGSLHDDLPRCKFKFSNAIKSLEEKRRWPSDRGSHYSFFYHEIALPVALQRANYDNFKMKFISGNAPRDATQTVVSTYIESIAIWTWTEMETRINRINFCATIDLKCKLCNF